MKIKAIHCPRCGDVIYSRARHDFHGCTCGLVFIDGGFDYWKVSITDPALVRDVDVVILEVDATEEKLYDDWNQGIDKYGVIKGV